MPSLPSTPKGRMQQPTQAGSCWLAVLWEAEAYASAAKPKPALRLHTAIASGNSPITRKQSQRALKHTARALQTPRRETQVEAWVTFNQDCSLLEQSRLKTCFFCCMVCYLPGPHSAPLSLPAGTCVPQRGLQG